MTIISKNQNGFTLIELLIALVIFAVGILGVGTMQLSSIQGNNKGRQISDAATGAADQMENFLSFAYDDFLDASLTDTDIKRDMRRSLVDFEIMKNLAKKYAKSSVSFGTGYRAWWSNTNKGFQFSDRKTTAFRTQPYFKVYHKPTELVNRSNDFYTKYLSNIDLSDVVRYEFTIKNRDHFEYLFGFWGRHGQINLGTHVKC